MNPTKKPPLLGKAIQRIRKYKDISHLDMMETLEVSQATYSRIETGKKEITRLYVCEVP